MKREKRKKGIVGFLRSTLKTLLVIAIVLNFSAWVYLGQKRQAIKRGLEYWQTVVNNHPEYPDGWAKLASLWYNLGEETLAKNAIEKARELDPVREEFKKLGSRF